MANNKKAVFGLCDNESQADRIVQKLQNEGFSTDEISVLYSDRSGKVQRERVTETRTTTHGAYGTEDTLGTTRTTGTHRDRDIADATRDRDYTETTKETRGKKGSVGHENTTKAPEGAATGGTLGGIIGGSLGLLAGIGALAIPGVGPFIAAGPIVAALSGSAVGGSLGLLLGALVGLGIPEYEAKKYEHSLKDGHILLCVHTAQVDRAKEILKANGAHDISTSSEKSGVR